jgi:hypothetical protein
MVSLPNSTDESAIETIESERSNAFSPPLSAFVAAGRGDLVGVGWVLRRWLALVIASSRSSGDFDDMAPRNEADTVV